MESFRIRIMRCLAVLAFAKPVRVAGFLIQKPPLNQRLTPFLTRLTPFVSKRSSTTGPLYVSTLTNEGLAKPLNLTDYSLGQSMVRHPGLTNELREPSTTNGFPRPSTVEFVKWDLNQNEENEVDSNGMYPFVNMIRGSASYIAQHRGEVAVFHIPGDLIESEGFPQLMDDIALAWLLGLKIVVVLGCRFKQEYCPSFTNEHECENSLHVTDEHSIHALEEEAGYVRIEVERQLNRRLRLNNGMCSDRKDAPAPSGNVLSGNFYTAKRFGSVRGVDYEFAGVPDRVHAEKIASCNENNDVVLLSTVSTNRMGDLVNVNGNHLAAFVAASLGASKLIYFSTEGTILRNKNTNKHLQDLPLSFAQSLVDHYNVQVHQAGFASFEEAQELLEPFAVEKLLHLGWSTWALENGVTRAHIVGPGDGSLLEELFTAKEGANTCIHQDNKSEDADETNDIFDDFPNYLSTPERVVVSATAPFS